MIPETREFEFASLGFIPLSYYKNRDYACFFSANSAQKPALYDTADATANSRINARLPYIFLLSRIAHYPATFKAGGADNTSQYLLGTGGAGDTRLRSGSRYAAVAISGAAAGDDAAGTDGGGNGGAGAAAGTGYAHAGLSP